MSLLKAQLQQAVKAAMRAKDKPTLSVLRLVSAAIKQREVDERIELDDTQVLAVIEKQVKQRREAIAQFADADRQDLVNKEQFELDCLLTFLPEPMADDALHALIEETIAQTGANAVADMGKVMAELKPKLVGRADMRAVSQKVRQRLA